VRVTGAVLASINTLRKTSGRGIIAPQAEEGAEHMLRNQTLRRTIEFLIAVALLIAFAWGFVQVAVWNQDNNDRRSCEAAHNNTGQVTDQCAELLGGR